MKKGIVEKIVAGGWGLVRSKEGVVFLNNVLPEEEVTYRIKERAKGILWGEVRDILIPSANRCRPPCPYYGLCGGCILQHTAYENQIKIKKAIFSEALARSNMNPELIQTTEIHPSPPFHYRFRARLKSTAEGKLGFIKKGTHQVIPINHCLLFPQAINTFLNQWNQIESPPFFFQMNLNWQPKTEKIFNHLSHPPTKTVEPFFKAFKNNIFSWKGNEQKGVFKIDVANYQYFMSPAVFFQVNYFQWSTMLKILDSLLHPCSTIIDLFCGVGFFTPVINRYAASSMGVESQGLAVNLAQKAFPETSFFKCRAELFHFPQADILVLDPPRSGITNDLMKRLLRKKYPIIIYISCSPPTLARDLNLLQKNNYQIKKIHLIDLFPQTTHIESISLLEFNHS